MKTIETSFDTQGYIMTD